jgi:small subunit ribosomal protein S15
LPAPIAAKIPCSDAQHLLLGRLKRKAGENILTGPDFQLLNFAELFAKSIAELKKLPIFAFLKNKNKNTVTMYLTSEIKKDIFKKHGKTDTNTGSSEGQIALFSFRIDHLTEHLKKNKKDFGTQKALINLVGKRRSLLDYLKNTDIERYRAVVKTLDLRK